MTQLKKTITVAERKAAIAILEKYNLSTKNTIPFDDNYNTDFEIGDDYISLSFECTALPHCCGVSEIGNFDTNHSKDDDDKVVEITSAILTMMIVNTPKEKLEGHRILVNTVTSGISNTALHNAVSESGLFEQYDSFRNKNSRNIVYMWKLKDIKVCTPRVTKK